MPRNRKLFIILIVLLVLACLLLNFVILRPARSQGTYNLYAPLIMHWRPTSTPIPVYPTGKIIIQRIFYDGPGTVVPGGDEYVEIENIDTGWIQLKSWTLSDAQNHVFTFPLRAIGPGMTCRIYTHQKPTNSCSFSYYSSASIWDSTGDCASLRDGQGTLISKKCY